MIYTVSYALQQFLSTTFPNDAHTEKYPFVAGVLVLSAFYVNPTKNIEENSPKSQQGSSFYDRLNVKTDTNVFHNFYHRILTKSLLLDC